MNWIDLNHIRLVHLTNSSHHSTRIQQQGWVVATIAVARAPVPYLVWNVIETRTHNCVRTISCTTRMKVCLMCRRQTLPVFCQLVPNRPHAADDCLKTHICCSHSFSNNLILHIICCNTVYRISRTHTFHQQDLRQQQTHPHTPLHRIILGNLPHIVRLLLVQKRLLSIPMIPQHNYLVSKRMPLQIRIFWVECQPIYHSTRLWSLIEAPRMDMKSSI